MIVWAFMNDIEREEDDPAETHLQKLQCALENLWKHKDFYNQAFAMDSQNDLMERIVRRTGDKNSERLDQMELEQQQKEKMLLSVTYHVHGGIACVQKWLQGGDSLTVEELASLMYNALPLSVKTIRSMEMEPEKTPS